ncbi:hypothetical protein F2Q70_00015117 [Brassica cretica]|uniref:Uncharacterized protein n=1 Tax=Brassica cretica TaxID=69181 RepID=A0A8S9I2Z9_BRACR|nr:hypothetical protein F2Q70_00015117 [Brassica cretica]
MTEPDQMSELIKTSDNLLQIYFSAARDSEDERGRKLKGKATAENTSDRETNLAPIRAASGILKIFDPVQTELPVNQAIMEKEKEIVTSPERVISLRSSVETGAPPLNRPSLEELYKPADDEQDMTEEELKEFEEQYASVQIEMDEDMMDNDDLLDETMVEETMVEETMVPESQSADTKGLAASKKLANRGRASPKGKQAKQGRLFMTKAPSSTVVPRIEVNSPDSQRTISETHRYNRRDGAGRRHHSPRQQSRMEWQPTREPEKRGDEQMAPSPNRMNVREAARDSEDERGRKLKGKATAENTSDKETNLAPIRAASGILKIFDPVQTELPVNQAIMEKEKEIVTSPERVISLQSSVETGAPPLNRPSHEELYKPTDDEQDMTEES